jgi:hypothetical protein
VLVSQHRWVQQGERMSVLAQAYLHGGGR